MQRIVCNDAELTIEVGVVRERGGAADARLPLQGDATGWLTQWSLQLAGSMLIQALQHDHQCSSDVPLANWPCMFAHVPCHTCYRLQHCSPQVCRVCVYSMAHSRGVAQASTAAATSPAGHAKAFASAAPCNMPIMLCYICLRDVSNSASIRP
jgi:hypothetical protein